MVSVRKLHSHLKRLSQNNLNGTRIEFGFKRAFATLFGQDIETFTGTMFLNMEQLEKQLDKEDFQEIGSMAAFNVLETHFQMFITSRIYLTDEVAMIRSYFQQYTKLAIPEFHDTLIQHMESIQKSIDERAQHKREYDNWVYERQMHTSKAKRDTSRRLGNDSHDEDVDIRPIYNEELMADVQMTVEINIFAIGQQHAEQPEFNNEGEVDQNAKQLDEKKGSWNPKRESMICCGQFVTKITKTLGILSDEVLDRLSAPTYCRALDVNTPKELTGTNEGLIVEDPTPGIPRVATLRGPHTTITDLYDKISLIEICQGMLERMACRQLYHTDRYAGMFEHMAR
uniref:Uncharacterized protein n=1 Tax=Tanacetum cinerariifolium TaxID=118510 RepID=A0A6L2NKQ4_TANCI|nr:hypothetical protein [Tanacetum cinerariifolium]